MSDLGLALAIYFCLIWVVFTIAMISQAIYQDGRHSMRNEIWDKEKQDKLNRDLDDLTRLRRF